MTSPDIKALAAKLRDALHHRDIGLWYTNCLELICASYGLRSRNVVITTQTALSPVPSGLLRKKANRILANKPGWIEPCIEETIRITHPTPTIALSAHGIPLNPENLTKSKYYENLINSITSDIFYEAYPSNGDEFDQKTLNKYFRSALNALASSGYASDGLADAVEAKELWVETDGNSPSMAFEDIIDSLEDDGETTAAAAYQSAKEDIKSSISDSVIEKLNEKDTSSPTDVFNSYDRAELIIVLGNDPKYYWDDSYIYQHDDGKLTPNSALKDAMRILGLNIDTFENLTDEAPAPDSTAPMRPSPLLSIDDFQAIIDDIGTWAFNLIIYATIPMKQIGQLDAAKAITLDKCVVAAYDGLNGRLSEHPVSDRVVINLDDTVRLYTGTDFSYSPLKLSGYIPSVYKAEIEPAWPYGTPLPSSDEARNAAEKLMNTEPATEEYTTTGIALLTAIATACNQSDTFTASADKPQSADDTDFAITTAKLEKDSRTITSDPITPALAQWLDNTPKALRSPSRGPGSTLRNQTNILTRTGLRDLAKAILSAHSPDSQD